MSFRSDLPRRGCLVLAVFVSTSLAASASAAPLQSTPADPDAIYGGELSAVCQWPTTLSVDTSVSYCTGTLVHPEIMVYAAHCVAGPNAGGILFGEWDGDPNGQWLNTEYCKAHPEFGSPVGNNDIAFCKLSIPVVGPPPTPIAMGCETELLVEGQEIVIAGFGQTDSGEAAYKHHATTTLGPPADGLPNAVRIGGGGVGACVGDSGGPAYLQLDDGTWRAFGVVSGGSACGQDGLYMLMHPYVGWIEAESGIDITPCHDADGTWNPTAECGGFATEPAAEGLSWDNGCAGEVSGSGSSCGEPFGGALDEEPPTVDITAPADGTTYADPAEVDFEVEADDGPGSGIHEVWLSVNGKEQVERDGTAPYAFEQVALEAGTVEVIAFAIDNDGNVGMSSPVTLVVGDPDVPPDSGGTGGGTSGGSGDTDDSDSGAGLGGSDEEAGCSCRSDPGTGPVGLGLLLGLVGMLRRRTR